MATADRQRTTRIERDSMGEMEVPAEAYYGASTMRAVLNFPISDVRFSRRFIGALGLIKLAAARVNMDLGLLDQRLGGAIVQAAQEVVDGVHDGEFVVDIFQTGSGTSTNTNANEVIANRATELLGGDRGSKTVHPNDHVNICQSSNDVIPAAMQLAALQAIKAELRPGLAALQRSLEGKAAEFWPIVKTGRTHLQDATPIRLGQEFKGYAGQAERGLRRLNHAEAELGELPLGGTAVGTGVNAHPEFASRVCATLSELAGVSVQETENHFQAQNSLDAVVETSGVLRTIAISLYKVANDLRWLGAGPRAGIAEIALPEVQPGSSIMPGKVNPVIPESTTPGRSPGHRQRRRRCGRRPGQLLRAEHDDARGRPQPASEHLPPRRRRRPTWPPSAWRASRPPAGARTWWSAASWWATALAPEIGYDAAAAIAKEAAATDRTVREVAREKTGLSDADLTRILDPEKMTEPGLGGAPAGG